MRAVKIAIDAPVVEKWALGYLIDVIYLRDVWMHRVDTARATGAELVLTPDHDGRIVADVVAEWARRHGQPFTLELTGPAGGAFTAGGGGEPTVIDAVEFCCLLAGRGEPTGLFTTIVRSDDHHDDHHDTTTTEIADDIYRISTFVPDAGMTFNQILVNADEPLLFHTGMRALFPLVSDAVNAVLPVSSLRWISFGHVEADECGSINQWLEAAPNAEVAFGGLGCMVSVNDIADRPPRPLEDGDVIDLGGKRVRYLCHAPRPARVGGWRPLRGDHVDAVVRRPLHPARRRPCSPHRLADGADDRGRGHVRLLVPHSLDRTDRRPAGGPCTVHTRTDARAELRGRWRQPWLRDLAADYRRRSELSLATA